MNNNERDHGFVGTNYELVAMMHKKFGILPHLEPTLLDTDDFLGRMEMVLEEVMEAMRGHRNRDLPEVADALIDCAVFLMGTAHLMGLPWDELFAEVQRANCTKERGTGIRKNKLDLIKPPGWTSPNIAGILFRAITASRKERTNR